MTSYSKSTIKTSQNCNGLVVYNSTTLIYADYGNNNLYSIPANSNTETQLGSASAVGTLGAIGIYGNNIYTFGASGYYYNYYTVDGELADTNGSGIFSNDLAHVYSLGNMYLKDTNTAYVATTYQSSGSSYIYKITGITGTLSASPIITFSTGTTYNIGGVTSDGTYLYVAYVDTGNTDVRVMRFNIATNLSSSLTLTSENYNGYIFYTISSVSSPERCDCCYFNGLLYVLASNASSTKIYSRDGSGSVVDITSGAATIGSRSNTFTVGQSGYGLKFFVSTGVGSGYSATNSGTSIIKLYPSTAPTLTASLGGDPHIKPMFSKTTYIIPNMLDCYNYFDSLHTEKNERFVINGKLWTIDYNFIANVTDIKDELNIRKHIKYDNILQTDSGFNKYISLIYELNGVTEHVIIDMESLDSVSYDDILVDKYELAKSDKQYNLFNISDTVTLDDKYKINITLNTIMFGLISITCFKYKYRKNHRNDFDIAFENNDNFMNAEGVIIDEKTLHTVPNLLHVDKNMDKCNIGNNIKMPTLDEHKQLIKSSNLSKMKKLIIF